MLTEATVVTMLVKVVWPIVKSKAAKALEGEHDEVVRHLQDAIERGSKKFFEKYGDTFGSPHNSFLARQENWEHITQSIFYGRANVEASNIDGHGFDNAPEATLEAKEFLVDVLFEEMHRYRVLDEILTLKKHLLQQEKFRKETARSLDEIWQVLKNRLKLDLSEEWFHRRFSEAIASAGPRYTPKLHIDLDISRYFDGLCRTSGFHERMRRLVGAVRKNYRQSTQRGGPSAAPEIFKILRNSYNKLSEAVEALRLDVAPIDWEGIRTFADDTAEQALACEQKFEDLAETERQAQIEAGSASSDVPDNRFSAERYRLRDLYRSLKDLSDFAQDEEATASNVAALLVVGEAGTGKTHLFCDVARSRLDNGRATVLLMGQHFEKGEPWQQILTELSLSCTRDEFLGALQQFAQERRERALILIDALNEGEGKSIWQKRLAAMLDVLHDFPWVAIGLSVRSSYESIVIPSGLARNKLIRIQHHGFAGKEYEAVRLFFEAHGLELPSIPLLAPEFRNPLFLKLFCKGLKNEGLTRIPPGHQGVTSIFDLFISSVDKKLSHPDVLNYDPKASLALKATQRIADAMAEKRQRWLPREEAKTIVNALLLGRSWDDSLFRHLISEGVIAEDILDPLGEPIEGVHFSYERLSDHLIARHLLDKHLNEEDPSDTFSADGPLGYLVSDERTAWINEGVLEALSVQLPERVGKELGELASKAVEFRAVRSAFVESIIWRDPETVTQKTLDHARRHVFPYRDSNRDFLNAILTVTTSTSHPFNADFLHRYLFEKNLANRDAGWSILIHREFSSNDSGPVHRLLDWALSDSDKRHIDDEAIRLACVTIAWFLSTSNRRLRDRATKALVALLTPRLVVLEKVRRIFEDVNDPYVLERIYAAVYGCVMRSIDMSGIGQIAELVFERIFLGRVPPPDLLLRDYARGIVEFAISLGVANTSWLRHIRAPYGSSWPEQIPTEEQIKKYDEFERPLSEEDRGQLILYMSVMGFGDFARYTIGTNHPSQFEWKARRLDEDEPYGEQAYTLFIDELSGEQKQAFDDYKTARDTLEISRLYSRTGLDLTKSSESRIDGTEKLEAEVVNREEQLLSLLGEEQKKHFNKRVKPHLDDPRDHEHDFDLGEVQRWIFQKIIDLGWSKGLFGRFDATVDWNRKRNEHAVERIGKKYQWIALQEILARIADNFVFSEKYPYEGPYQLIGNRNIDPSQLLPATKRDDWLDSHTLCWWADVVYDWDQAVDGDEWLLQRDDLPPLEPFVQVSDPSNTRRWITLYAHYRWVEPVSAGEEDDIDIPRRDLWYTLKCVLVNKSEAEKIYRSVGSPPEKQLWLSDPNEPDGRVFLGEYFWAPAYAFGTRSETGRKAWDDLQLGNEEVQVHIPVEKYFWEKTFDHSIDNTISILLPSQWLADSMSLRWNGISGWLKEDQLVALDPSVESEGPAAFLTDRGLFLKMLDDNNLTALWTITGEKSIRSEPLGGPGPMTDIFAIARLGDDGIQSKWQLFPREV